MGKSITSPRGGGAPKKPKTVKDGTSAAFYLKDCKNICFLTGAGLSEESGITWYRGTFDVKLDSKYGGTTDQRKVLTNAFYRENPKEFWRWHFDFLEHVA